ncbi:MAG: hypothetical protein R3C61_02510 [Bacteroidia bacterium]
MDTTLSPDAQKTLRSHRLRLWLLILVSSGIDLAIFFFETPLIISFWGASLVLDEIVEYFISRLLAGSRIELKRWYKVFGVLPVPGITALTSQALVELIRSHRKPHKVLDRLSVANVEE